MSSTTQGCGWRRMLAGALRALALMLLVGPAAAAVDFLDLPALKSAKAASAIMLAAALAGSRVVVAGERGIVLYSDDGGRHWAQSEVPVSVTLTALYFLDAKQGWAVGHDGAVLHTADGGKSWDKQVDGYRLNEIARTDAQEQLYRLQQSASGAGGDTEAVRQVLEQAQFMLDDVTAGAQFGPSRPLLGVWFDRQGRGLVVGANGQVFRSADAGRSWRSAARNLNNPDALHYNAIVADDRGELFVAGEAGRIYQGSVEGAWQTIDTGYNGALYGVLPVATAASEVLLAYGFGGHIFRSVDAGRSWTPVQPQEKVGTLVAGLRTADGKVLLLAQDGSLIESADAGQSFHTRRPSPGLRVAAMVQLADGALVVAGIGGAQRVELERAVAQAGETRP